MGRILEFLILIPLLGFISSLVIPAIKERAVAAIAIVTMIIQMSLFAVFFWQWAGTGYSDIFQISLEIYKSADYNFSVSFFYDRITAVYFTVALLITLPVIIFSRYYLHREKGFKRFFTNVLFFYFGLNLILFSGNLETLFIGWEIIGMGSFFLIAFYRDRYLPVKNALKVISIYRVADIALLFGIWLCHHYFHKSINFLEIKEMFQNGLTVISEEPYQIVIPLIFLVAAAVKSAQFPFSSWLPRAMEGPTSSSAIFYGSLSVHIGVFLMIRTYPLWESSFLFKVILISMGLVTSLIATTIARVQSSVKTQIAYSSISQLGLMFVEVGLGFHTLALLHFTGNAFLRTYQLLVAPSVLSYLIHDQFFNFIKPENMMPDNFRGRLKATIYLLSIKEWNMDSNMYNYLWKPLKFAGNKIRFINAATVLYIFTPLYAAGLYFAYNKPSLPVIITGYFPLLTALISLAMTLKAFTKRNEATKSWFLITASQFYLGLAISFNDKVEIPQLIMFLSGITISYIVGYICIIILKRHNEGISLDRFHGHSYEHEKLGVVFLIACLGLAGFPITPTFIGEDIILSYINDNQIFLSLLISASLIMGGLAIFRIYSRLFNGPHEKEYHEIAYRSS